MNGRRYLAWLVAGLVGGCTVGPDYRSPEFETPPAYAAQPIEAEASGAPWWAAFDDPVLGRLIDTALARNRDVAAAIAVLGEAEAAVRAQRSDLFPGVDGYAQSQHRSDFSGSTSDAREGGLVFSFVPDVFGGQRRRVEYAEAIAMAQRYTVADVRRLTASAVAGLYVELRRSQARLALLDTSLDLQNQTLEIVQARNSAGLSPDLDVQRAAADLAQTRAQRGALETSRVQAENALAVLVGSMSFAAVGAEPASGSRGRIPLFASGPPVGTPADLLRRRPDLRAAEARLVAATADIGVETADLYPSLSLPAQLTADLGSGLDLAERMVGVVTAAIDVPLLDAGRRRAEISAAEQRARAALLAYEQTLLVSVSEVETALATIHFRADQRAELERAVQASEEAYDQLDGLYREGLTTFIDILDAQRTLISSREAYVDSEAELAFSYIDLYTALGSSTPATGSTFDSVNQFDS